MCRHQLLLLVECIQKAKRMCAEADDSHDRQQHKRTAGPRRYARTLAPGCRSEHYKRQHKSSGGLDADSGNEQGGCGPQVASLACALARALAVCPGASWRQVCPSVCLNGDAPRARGGHACFFASCQRQCPSQDKQHERVVVGPTYR
jgi:hypothetical protein